MKTLVVSPLVDSPHHAGTVDVSGVPIHLGIREVERPSFDPSLPMFRDAALIEVEAFSCNYRDKALVVDVALRMQRRNRPRYLHFGSEFSGTVVATGADVTTLAVGDRVMPDASYPEPPAPGESPGIVTNNASRGWLVVHESKLATLPETMSSVDAAGFSLAAHTASSMVRRAALPPHAEVIVGSSRSSTGLSLIRVLLMHGHRVTAVSSRPWTDDERRLIDPDGAVRFTTFDDLAGAGIPHVAAAVFDPFADRNFARLEPLLDYDGRYVTCGFKDQHAAMVQPDEQTLPFQQALARLITGNKTLVGNCIGLPDDFAAAIAAGGRIAPPVDTVFDPDQAAEFVDRSFNTFDKFGKVILRYR